MIELDIITFYDRLKEKWETKGGLIISILFIVFTYFSIFSWSEVTKNNSWKFFFFFVIPLGLIILIFLIWIYTTNRFFIRFNNKITVGIILINDDDKDKLIVSKIIRKVIHHINNSKEFSNVNLKILPSNFCKSDSETVKYHKNFIFMYDVIIQIHIDGGKFDSIEKIKVEKFSMTFKPKNSNRKKRIFFNIVDLSQDMSLLVNSRDWEYTLNNSGIDKKKYFENIHQVLLYYIAFYSIYIDRFEDALNIISPIFDSKKTIIPISKKEGNQIELILKPYNLSEGRISTILVDLFFYTAIKNYINSDTKKALNYFEKLETIIKSHSLKFEQYINMARYSYELGNLEDAIMYTEKSREVDSTRVEIYLNLGFFSLLNNDINEFCKNYLKIFNNRFNNNINWVDVLEFQLRQRDLIPDREEYFNFSISFIEYVFIDIVNKDEFVKIFSSYKELINYRNFYKLGTTIMENRVKPKGSNFTPKRKKRQINGK